MRLFVCFFLVLICNTTEGKRCIQDGQCKCTFDDGSGTVDLSPIGRQDGTPLMHNWIGPDNYVYSFNPCYPFTEGTCVNAAACQYDSVYNIYNNIGDSSKVTLSYNGINVVGTYESDDGARSSDVTFQCDLNADSPTATTSGEISTTVYGFTITSKYACPTSQPTPTPGEGCYTSFGDFTKKCTKTYDGKDGYIKLLIIEDWNGGCLFPENEDVALSLHNTKFTCDHVITRCNPVHAFSVNDYVCKEVDQRTKNSDLIG